MNGQRVLRRIPSLERGVVRDIFIRSCTISFWQACVDTANSGSRVCAVGTAGIGKTTTIPILIRLLLQNGSTVVFLVRSVDRTSFYFEFTPARLQDGSYSTSANVYPEKDGMYTIHSLQFDGTYYIVDPGDTVKSNNPALMFKPKTIIVASPDGKHWGGPAFTKRQGKFLFLPIWTLQELHAARTFIPVVNYATGFNQIVTALTVDERFEQVGDVPRHVFCSDDDYKNALRDQDWSLPSLSAEQVADIQSQRVGNIASFDDKQPTSALVGFENAEKNDISSCVMNLTWKKLSVGECGHH